MTRRHLARWRLRAQSITDARFTSPEDVVRWLGAVQSQEQAVAKWSVGMRCGAGEEVLDRALAEGTILRTHVLRPTWHFVLPADIVWMLELTGDRVRAAVATYDRRLELDARLLARSDAIIARAVEDGHRTRGELADTLAKNGIEASTNRLAHIVMHAELRGVVCSGAPRGAQQTYASVAERAPNARRLGRDKALAELARRYFTGHGPATLRDFRWWSGLRAGDARQGLEALGDTVHAFDADDRTYFHVDPPPAEPLRANRSIHLLQGYDEYIVAYTESRDVIDVDGLATNLRATRPPFTHAVVRDGQVIGHWRRRPAAKRVGIDVQRRCPLGAAGERALDAAARRYGAFTGVPTSVLREGAQGAGQPA